MSTTTHYVVRKDNGELERLDQGYATGFRGWVLPGFGSKLDSRKEAERLAAEHGGTVHRIAVTDEAVGLRWVACSGTCRGGILRDGDQAAAEVHNWEGGDRYDAWLVGVSRWTNPIVLEATLDEAKVAAEAAVRAGWES